MKRINCQCCGKKVEKFGNQRFCNRCSIYLLDLKSKLSHYKNEIRKLKGFIYGTPNPNERIRWKDKEDEQERLRKWRETRNKIKW